MNRACLSLAVFAGMMTLSCHSPEKEAEKPTTFPEDLAALRERTDIHVLRDPESGARVAVAPLWQARVMTSAWAGDPENGHGVVARPDAGSPTRDFGGEEIPRLVAGGSAGVGSFETGAFRVTASTDNLIQCEAEGTLAFPGRERQAFRIERAIQILDKGEMARLLGIPVSSTLKAVGYRSTSVIQGPGGEPWAVDGTAVDLRFQGSLHCSPRALLVVPAPEHPEFPPGNRWKPCGKALAQGSNGLLEYPAWPVETAGARLCVYDPKQNRMTLVMNGFRTENDPAASEPVVPVPRETGNPKIRTTIHLQGSAEEVDAILRNLLGTSLGEVTAAGKR